MTRARAEVWPPLPPPLGPVDADAVEAAAAEFAARCPGRLGQHVPVAPLSTFRLGGPARLLLHAESLVDLVALGEVLAATGLPLLVLGRGSNLLVADAGWLGVVLQLGKRMGAIAVDGEEIEAGGAAALPSLAARSAAASLRGLAFAVAIPGSVGGGVRMNAGAHGGEIADRLVWAEIVDLAVGAAPEPVRRQPDLLGLAYRRSELPQTAVVTVARFACEPASKASVPGAIGPARRWRRDNQPVHQPTCGSVFANPLPHSAPATNWAWSCAPRSSWWATSRRGKAHRARPSQARQHGQAAAAPHRLTHPRAPPGDHRRAALQPGRGARAATLATCSMERSA